MKYRETNSSDEIYSKVLRAGRRTYFFDVRKTKADDYYLTITESKKFTNEDETFYYKKHKIYLYKEDFQGFKEYLDDTVDYILKAKGEDVISESHKGSSFDKNEDSKDDSSSFTNIKFEDI